MKDSWDEMDSVAQAQIIAYDQLRGYEDSEDDNDRLKALAASGIH